MLNRLSAVAAASAMLAACCVCGLAQGQIAGNGFSREVAKGPGVFNGPANDALVMRNPIPPLSEIPPMPMPFPANVPVNGQMANSIVVCDAETGKSEVIPGQVIPGLSGGRHEGRFPVEGPIGSEPTYSGRTFNTLSPITTRDVFPWSANCKVAMRFLNNVGGDAWYVCSGTMIDWSTVLLAGHCVYNIGNGIPTQWAQEVYVFPGWDGVNGMIVPPNGPGTNQTYGNFGYSRGTYLGAGGSWVSSGSRDQDYGFVGLNGSRAVGSLSGTFGTAWGYDCATIQGRTYHNAQYPSEACGTPGLHTGSTMLYWFGTWDSCPGNQLHLNTTAGCYTTGWGGSSGSGAYYIENGNRYVHAVASNSNRADSTNYAKLDQVGSNFIYNTFIPNTHGNTFDVQALDANFGPSSIQAGATTALQNFLMVNSTNGAANATWTVRVYLSSNDNLTSSDTLLSTQTIAWNFGAMSSVRVNMGAVAIPAATPPGTYWLGVIIDPGSDFNSGNNATHNWDAVQVTITPAAPANDLCGNATAVNEGVFSGNTTTANNEGSSVCATGTKDVWYRYIATATGTVAIHTCGSSFDTVVSVHTGCVGTTANQIVNACNDDRPAGTCGGIRDSYLTLPVTAGANYYIRVSGFSGLSGNYLLSIQGLPQTDDNCPNAYTIQPGTFTGSTGFANTDGAATCGYSANAPDVWYAITPGNDGLARFDTCGSSYDTVLSLYGGCPGQLDNELTCNDDAGPYGTCPYTLQSYIEYPVFTGVTYYLRVSGFNGHNGAYVLHYNLAANVNETCQNPIPVLSGSYPFNNSGTTTDGSTEANCLFCCGDLQVNRDLWYSLTMPCDATIELDTLGSTFDTKIAVYTYCPYGADAALVCNDDYFGVQSYVTFAGTSGTTYLIRVGAYATNFGDGVLNVTYAACPPTSCHGLCVADFDDGTATGVPDGGVGIEDLLYYLNLYDLGDVCADVDDGTGTGTTDGGVGIEDLLYYLAAYDSGC